MPLLPAEQQAALRINSTQATMAWFHPSQWEPRTTCTAWDCTMHWRKL